MPRRVPHRALPPYAWRRGLPHPTRSPDGHSFEADEPAITGPWRESEAFLYGCDLFDHGFYWEAHEAWELLWRSFERGSPERAALQALILCAAGRFHEADARTTSAVRCRARAAELFAAVPAELRSAIVRAVDVGLR